MLYCRERTASIFQWHKADNDCILKAKKNYCVTQQDLLAAVEVLEHFQICLYRQYSICAPSVLPLKNRWPAGFKGKHVFNERRYNDLCESPVFQLWETETVPPCGTSKCVTMIWQAETGQHPDSGFLSEGQLWTQWKLLVMRDSVSLRVSWWWGTVCHWESDGGEGQRATESRLVVRDSVPLSQLVVKECHWESAGGEGQRATEPAGGEGVPLSQPVVRECHWESASGEGQHARVPLRVSQWWGSATESQPVDSPRQLK
jgi:hypothetical protein